MNEQDTSMMKEFDDFWDNDESGEPEYNPPHSWFRSRAESTQYMREKVNEGSISEGLQIPECADDITFTATSPLIIARVTDSFLTFTGRNSVSYVTVPLVEDLNDQIVALQKEVAEMRAEMNNHTQPVVQQIEVNPGVHTHQFVVDRAKEGTDMTAVVTRYMNEAVEKQSRNMGRHYPSDAYTSGDYMRAILATEPSPFTVSIEDFKRSGILMVEKNDEKDFEHAMELAK